MIERMYQWLLHRLLSYTLCFCCFRDPYLIFSGGMPLEKEHMKHSLTIMNGSSVNILELDYVVVDFIVLCNSVYPYGKMTHLLLISFSSRLSIKCPVCLSASVFSVCIICLSACVVCWSVCRSIRVVCLYCLSVFSVCLPVCIVCLPCPSTLSVCLSVCLVRLPVCLPLLSVCLPCPFALSVCLYCLAAYLVRLPCLSVYLPASLSLLT